MMKKLSEYNKQIMAGVSVLLLVVFLAPTAVTQCSRLNAGHGTTWATTKDGDTLTLGDLETVRSQLRTLATLRELMSKALTPQALQQIQSSSPALRWVLQTQTHDPAHWWLLVKEAKDAGLVGGQAEGKQFLTALAAGNASAADTLLAQMASNSSQTPAAVLTTLAELVGVNRLMGLASGAPRPSEARLKATAQELLTSVACDVVPISGSGVGDAIQVPDPTMTQLEEQFKLGKASLPGQGPGGCGYKFDNQVVMQWLVIPAAELNRSTANDPALGPVELRKEFLRNVKQYSSPAPAGAPEPPPPSFESVKDRVKADVEKRLVKERTERISTYVRDWTRASLKDVPTNAGIYQLPADWEQKAPTLASLAQELATRFQIPAPTVESTGPNPVPLRTVSENAFIGRASTSEFGQPMSILRFLMELHEFKPDGRVPVQAGVVGPMLTTPPGDLVIFRVAKAVPAHEPASMDEVRTEVIKDTLAKLRYEALKAKAPEILDRAIKSGLAVVAKDYRSSVQPAPNVTLANPQVLKQFGLRMANYPPSAGNDVATIKAIMAKALALPSDKPVAAVPEAERTLTVDAPNTMSLLVVRITNVQPTSLEDWTALSKTGMIVEASRQEEGRVDPMKVFGLDAIKARHGFALRNPEGPDRPMPVQAPQF